MKSRQKSTNNSTPTYTSFMYTVRSLIAILPLIIPCSFTEFYGLIKLDSIETWIGPCPQLRSVYGYDLKIKHDHFIY